MRGVPEFLLIVDFFAAKNSVLEFSERTGPIATGMRQRSTVRNSALAVGASAGVVIDIEFELVGGNIETRLFRHPGDDFFENRPQEFLVEVFLIAQGKIEIF